MSNPAELNYGCAEAATAPGLLLLLGKTYYYFVILSVFMISKSYARTSLTFLSAL